MFCVVETVENDTVLCVAVPKTWISDGHLKWPHSYSAATRKRRNCDPPEPNWKVQECRILKDDIRKYSFCKLKDHFKALLFIR